MCYFQVPTALCTHLELLQAQEAPEFYLQWKEDERVLQWKFECLN